MNFGVSFDRKYFILYNKDRLVMKKGYPFFLLHAEGKRGTPFSFCTQKEISL